MNRKELFLRACRCEPVERVPVWIMRGAGRYLPEYQAVRKHHTFLEICKTPEIAAEVSMQPFHIIGVDAVIVFSDILIVAEAIRAIVREVGPEVPVIGFAAAPWTLACYMIEGRTRGDISIAKQMLTDEPALVHELLDRIADATVDYVKSQIEAGASVVQLFDTWAGEFSAEQYEAFELPATKKILDTLASAHPNVPRILYAKGSSHLVPQLARTAPDVLSVDWRTDLQEARAIVGDKIALQGNVDPSILLTLPESVREAAVDAVMATGGVGHILNLGHGILPNTPVENARAFVDAGKSVRVPDGGIPAGHEE